MAERSFHRTIDDLSAGFLVAFICGITVMWISRLIFSFNYKKSFKYLGAVWCGLALPAITYFAIFKGLKGSTLVTKDMIRHLDAHIWLYVCCSLVFWTCLLYTSELPAQAPQPGRDDGGAHGGDAPRAGGVGI